MSAIVVERQVDSKNQLWFRNAKDNKTEIGFTNNLLEQVRECWHVSPACRGQIKSNQPLITIEMCDSQFTIPSPVAGALISFNNDALNFPDLLTDADVICILGDKKDQPAKKPAVAVDGIRRNAVRQEPVIGRWGGVEVRDVPVRREGMWVPQDQIIPNGDVAVNLRNFNAVNVPEVDPAPPPPPARLWNNMNEIQFRNYLVQNNIRNDVPAVRNIFRDTYGVNP